MFVRQIAGRSTTVLYSSMYCEIGGSGGPTTRVTGVELQGRQDKGKSRVRTTTLVTNGEVAKRVRAPAAPESISLQVPHSFCYGRLWPGTNL